MEEERKREEEKKEAGSRKREFVRILKYALFAASAGIIQMVTFTLLNEVAHLNYWASYLIALVLSVLWNFTFNRKFTFRSANNVPIAMLKVALYYAVFTPLSTLWGNALEGIGWNEYAVLVPTMLVNFVTEFLYCRFFVFGKSIDTAKKRPRGAACAAEEAERGEEPSSEDGGEA